MKTNQLAYRLTALVIACAMATLGAACSKADKTADDVAAMRALMERQDAEKRATEEKAKAENLAAMAKLKAQAASDAKALGAK